MQENEQINSEENDLQQNYQNNYFVPQNPPPQYNEPQMAPIYQPPNKTVEQMIQSPSYGSNNPNNTTNNGADSPQRAVDYTPWDILSFISWILFISSKWDLYNKMSRLSGESYRPIIYNASFIQLVTLIISLIGFLVYVKNIIYKKNSAFYNGLFGQNSKYHFIPLIFYSGINMVLSIYVVGLMGGINPTTVDRIYTNSKFDLKALCAFYMIFSLLSLLSLMFIYYSTELNCEWYIVMSIKKGVYSILIVESLYFFFDSIFYLRFVNIYGSLSNAQNLYNTGGVMFALFQGVIIIGFSLYFKDITMPILNFLMFYGMVLNFYNKSSYAAYNDEDDYKKSANIVEIIMIILHFLLIVFMIAKYKEQLIQS